LLRLLNQRARCAQKVGEIKAAHGEAGHIYRPEREAQVLRRLQDANPGPLPSENITFFFREVMSACLSLEEPLGIAFLGPLGSFTGSAATKHFGHAARLLPQSSIDDVFREVESGHAHYAVVPVENSTEGAVGRSMDLLLATPLKICGEVVLRIHQNLLTNEADLSKITKVYSHAQSLAQCHEWLNRNLPGIARISVAAIRRLPSWLLRKWALRRLLARRLRLVTICPSLAENIEDEPNNTTRFLVLGKHDAGPIRPRQDLADHVGPKSYRCPARTAAAFFAVRAFPCAVLNPARPAMPCGNTFSTSISKAIATKPAVKAALDELASAPAYLKILGSYPVAVY
jgi:chorismate mutase/prephenate dehydratase